MWPSGFGRVLVSIFAAMSVVLGILPVPALQGQAHADPGAPPNGYAETIPVGRIPASAGVDDQGHATYSIPLEMPANRGDLLPTLSLEYNSGGGLGTYGEGWMLSGIPTLSYCHHAQGVYGWCYNGDPLIPVSSPEDIYYPDGDPPARRFRTHPDSSVRATSAQVDGVSGEVLDGWLIENPDGTQVHFLFDQQSDELAVTPYRISDRFGNHVEFEGFDNFPEFEDEARILYTGNLRTQSEPQREVVVRRDAIIFPGRYYRLGIENNKTCGDDKKCLSKDGPAGAATQLASITLCEGHPADGSPGVCLPPTRFEYSASVPELNEQLFAYPPGLHIPKNPCHGPIFADFDGNGITDVLWGDGEKNNGGGCSNDSISIYLQQTVGVSGTTLAGLISVPANSQILTVDVDADGRIDVVFSDSNSAAMHVVRWIGGPSGLVHGVIPLEDATGIDGWAVADLDRNGSQDLVVCALRDGEPGELRAYRGSVDESMAFFWEEEALWSAHNPELEVSRSCLESNYTSVHSPAGAQIRIARLEDREQPIHPDPNQPEKSTTIEVPLGGTIFGGEGGFVIAVDDSLEFSPNRFFEIVAPPSIDGSIRALRVPLHDEPDSHFGFGGAWHEVADPCLDDGPDPVTGLYDSCPEFDFVPGWDTAAELARVEYRPTIAALAEPRSNYPLEAQWKSYAENTLAEGGLSLAPIDAAVTDDESDGIAELGAAARQTLFFDWNDDGFQDLLYPVFEPGATEGHWEVSLWDSAGQTLGDGGDLVDPSGGFSQGVATGIPAWSDERKRLFVVELDGYPGPELAVMEEEGDYSLIYEWSRTKYSGVPHPRLLDRVVDGFGRVTRYDYNTAAYLTLEDPACTSAGMKTLGDGGGPLVRCEVPDDVLVSQISEEADDDGDHLSRYRYQGASRDLGTDRFRGFERIIEEEVRSPAPFVNPDRVIHVREVSWADVVHNTPNGVQGPFTATNLGVGLPSLPRYSLSLSITGGVAQDASATEYKWTELPNGTRVYAEVITQTSYNGILHSPTAYVDLGNPTLDQVKASFLEEYRSEVRREQVDEFGNVTTEVSIAGIGTEAVTSTVYRAYSPSVEESLALYASEVDNSVNQPFAYSGALIWDPSRLSSETVIDDDGVSRTTTFEYYEDEPTTPPCIDAPNWPFSCPPDLNPAGGMGGVLRAVVVEPGTSDELRTEFSYSLLGSVVQTRQSAAGASEARGTRTVFEDDDELFPGAVYNPLGHTQTTEWDEVLGVPNVVTNPRGVRTVVQTDGLGRAVRETVFGRNGTQLLATSEVSLQRMQVNDAGVQDATPSRLRVRTSVAGGGWSEVEYGGNGFPLLVRRAISPNSAPSIEEYVYSPLVPGQVFRAYVPRFEGTPSLAAHEFAYDARGRVVQVTDPVGNVVSTHYGFRAQDFIDAADESSGQKFDSLGRNVETIDEAGTRVCFSYDARSNVDLVTRGCGTLPVEEAVSDYDYDEFGRLASVDDPASGRTDLTYTAFGQIEFVVNGNDEEIYYVYDSLGRNSHRITADGYEQYFYDVPPEHPDVPGAVKDTGGTLGLLVGTASSGHSRWMVRDEFDRVVSEFDVVDGQMYQQDYRFDGYGRVNQTTFPSLSDDVVRQSFQYDALGNAEKIDVFAGSKYINVWEAQARDASGRVVLEKKGDVIFDRFYDDLGRLERQVGYGAGETIQDYGWGYTPRGEVDYRESFLTGEVEDFGYDEVGRLVSVDPSYGIAQAWDYDDWGNLVGAGRWGGPAEANGRLIQVGGVQDVDYDGAGRLRSLKTLSGGAYQVDIDYNVDGQPVSVSSAGGDSVSLKYGVGSQLLSRSEYQPGASVTDVYVGGYRARYKDETHLEEEYVELSGPTGPIGTIRWSPVSASVRYVSVDNLGSGERAYLSGGAFVDSDSRTYDVWGNARSADWAYDDAPVAGASFSESEVGYTGHRATTDAGLIEMGLRHYDPSMRRFTSPDPVTPDPLDPQSWNRYAYARGNPSTLVDPNGAAPYNPWDGTPQCDRNCTAGGGGLAGPLGTIGVGVYMLQRNWGDVRRGFRDVGRRIRNLFDRGGNGSTPPPMQMAYVPLATNSISFANSYNLSMPTSLGATADAEGHRSSAAGMSFGVAGMESGLNYVAGVYELSGPLSPFYSSVLFGYLGGGSIDPYSAEFQSGEMHAGIVSILAGLPGLVRGGTRLGGNVLRNGAREWFRQSARPALAAARARFSSTLRSWFGGAARAGSNLCFAEGTLVQTEKGLVPIEDVEVGDLVWSRDDETGEGGWKAVVELFVTPDQELLELTFEAEDGTEQVLRVTPEHPLWSLDDGEWDEAGQLDLGERVDALHGPMHLVAAVAVPTPETVYNFEVADSHTYFVGEAGVWAHNICVRGLLSRVTKSGFKPTQQASKMDLAKVERYAETMRNGKWNWGGLDKIIVDKNGAIVSGHHRVMASAEAGVQIPESGIFRMTTETIRPVYEWSQVLIP